MADGPNVGFATLSLIPSMKGSESVLAKISNQAGAQSGSLFQSSFAKEIKGHLGIAASAGMVGVLGAVGGGLFKLGAAFDEQFDKIRTKTGQTGDALKGLEGDLKNVLRTTATGFGEAGDAITVLNQKFGLTGKPLEALSKQVIDLARITDSDVGGLLQSVTDAFNGFDIDAVKQAPRSLDKLFRASQKSGVSVADLASQLADSGATLRAAGIGFDDSTALLAALGKAGLSASDVLPAFNRTLAKAAKEGKNANQFLKETFDTIRTSTPSIANNRALEVFGARGLKMGQLIREGKLDYQDLLRSIQGGKDTVEKASDDTADFAEKWQILKNKVLVGLEPLASRVFGAVGDGLDRVSAWWTANGPGVQEWLGNFGSTLQDTVGPAAEAVFNAFKDDLLPKLAEFGDWLSDHQGAMAAFAGILVVIAAAVIIATAPILAITIGVIALAVAVAYAYDKWGWFHTAVDAAVSIVKTMYDWVNKLIGVIDKLTDSLKKVPGLGGKSGGFLSEVLNNAAIQAIPGVGPAIAAGKAVKNILGFDVGGTIPGPLGKPRLVLAHGGEEVIPWHNAAAMRRYGARGSRTYAVGAFNDRPQVIQLVVDGRVLSQAVAKADRTTGRKSA